MFCILCSNINGLRPNRENYANLRTAEGLLKAAIAYNRDNATIMMEAHLLLAKLHYLAEVSF